MRIGLVYEYRGTSYNLSAERYHGGEKGKGGFGVSIKLAKLWLCAWGCHVTAGGKLVGD